METTLQLANSARLKRDATLLVEVLTRQQAILADPSWWTRVALARTSADVPVVPLSEGAWCWSLSGALALALFEVLGRAIGQADWQRLYDQAVDALWNALPDDHPRTRHRGRDLDGYNDFPGTDHQDVSDLIERALSQALPASVS